MTDSPGKSVGRVHGFSIDDVHVPFGTEALSRSGHALPTTTRAAYLSANAILVAVRAVESRMNEHVGRGLLEDDARVAERSAESPA